MKTRQMVCGIFAVLLLVCAGAGVFAQEKKPEAEAETAAEPAAPGVRKNAITLDTISLFKGFIASDNDSDTFFFCMALAYERLVAPHFTFGVDLDLYPGQIFDVDYVYFGLTAAGRFYPMSEYMEKFFIGANLGFNTQAIDGKSKPEYGGFTGLTIGLKAGYKLLFTDMFFAEPSLSYTYSKSGEFGGSAPLNLGWQGGLRIGVSL
jgi:hypothetical protein